MSEQLSVINVDPNAPLIKEVNLKYLLLVKQICDLDPAAAVTLGIPENLVNIVKKTSTDRIKDLSKNSSVLLAVPRIKNQDKWEKISIGQFDGDDLIHFLLTEA